jgi:uncharacterized membrane protein
MSKLADASVPRAKPDLPWIVRLSAPRRLGIVLIVAITTYLAFEPWIVARSRILIGWNTGALVYLMLAWTTIARADARMTRVRAQSHDQSGYVIFCWWSLLRARVSLPSDSLRVNSRTCRFGRARGI